MGTRLTIEWDLPTTREPSGRPLAVKDIDDVFIELSADLGANYVEIGSFPPDVLSVSVSDLADGDWLVRGTVSDKRGKAAPAVVESVSIDSDAPGPITLRLKLS